MTTNGWRRKEPRYWSIFPKYWSISTRRVIFKDILLSMWLHEHFCIPTSPQFHGQGVIKAPVLKWSWKMTITATYAREQCVDHDDVIKWKHFLRYWPFVRGIHQSPVNSPHKGQWRGALAFSFICAWINGWVNNREAGDLRRHRAHYGVIVMWHKLPYTNETHHVLRA